MPPTEKGRAMTPPTLTERLRWEIVINKGQPPGNPNGYQLTDRAIDLLPKRIKWSHLTIKGLADWPDEYREEETEEVEENSDTERFPRSMLKAADLLQSYGVNFFLVHIPKDEKFREFTLQEEKLYPSLWNISEGITFDPFIAIFCASMSWPVAAAVMKTEKLDDLKTYYGRSHLYGEWKGDDLGMTYNLCRALNRAESKLFLGCPHAHKIDLRNDTAFQYYLNLPQKTARRMKASEERSGDEPGSSSAEYMDPNQPKQEESRLLKVCDPETPGYEYWDHVRGPFQQTTWRRLDSKNVPRGGAQLSVLESLRNDLRNKDSFNFFVIFIPVTQRNSRFMIANHGGTCNEFVALYCTCYGWPTFATSRPPECLEDNMAFYKNRTDECGGWVKELDTSHNLCSALYQPNDPTFTALPFGDKIIKWVDKDLPS